MFSSHFILLLAVAYSVEGGALRTSHNSPAVTAFSLPSGANMGRGQLPSQNLPAAPNNQGGLVPAGPIHAVSASTHNLLLQHQQPQQQTNGASTQTNITAQLRMEIVNDVMQALARMNGAVAGVSNKQSTTSVPTTTSSTTTTTLGGNKNLWFQQILSRADVQEHIVELISIGKGDVGLFKDENDKCYLTDKDTENIYYQFDC